MVQRGTSWWTWAGILATALTLCHIEYAQAASTRPSNHKRVHIPRNVAYTLLRKRAEPVNHRRQALSFNGRDLGSPVHVGTNKRSTLPAPYEELNGLQEHPLYSDTVLLQFNIGEDEEEDRISLLLHPSEDLIHPDAKFTYTSTDPRTGLQIQHSEPLRRQDVLAYSGIVLKEEEVRARVMAAKVGMRELDEDRHGRGWARLVLSKDTQEQLVAEGAFHVDGEIHQLKSFSTFKRGGNHAQPELLQARHSEEHEGLVLLRDRDLEDGAFQPAKRAHTGTSSSCAHDRLEYNANPSHPIYADARQMAFNSNYGRPQGWLDSWLGVAHDDNTATAHVHRRQSTGNDVAGGNVSSNYINSIGSHTGCPKSNMVLYMGLAADCTYTQNYGSVAQARTQLLENVNSASALYQRSLNISLGVIELNVQDSDCPSTANSSVPWNVGCPDTDSNGIDLNTRLSAFSRWRGSKGGADGAGLWSLFTRCQSGSEVGVAWLGTLCRVSAAQSSSTGETSSGTSVTAITSREWQVFAHETGHNFGAIHDCDDGCSLNGYCCPLTTTTCDANAGYIMSPVSERNTTSFSQCTIGNVCSAIGNTLNTTCLYTPGNRQVISLQECGNGILEPGEECDPGAGSNSTCCDTSTCKLRDGAQCDPGTSTCCNSSCSFASNTTVCRPAVSEQCDIAESCTGSSADCPADKTKPDGESCGSGSLACASGYCTSKDEQCASLGSSLGLSQACSNPGDSSCQVTCANPNSTSSCIILDGQTFVDGSPCGYGGYCYSGACQSGSWQDTVKSWYTNNLRISIPVTVVAGIIALLLLWALIRCCIRCSRREHKRNEATAAQYYAPQSKPMAQQPFATGSQDTASGLLHNNQQLQGYQEPQQSYPVYSTNHQGGHYR